MYILLTSIDFKNKTSDLTFCVGRAKYAAIYSSFNTTAVYI